MDPISLFNKINQNEDQYQGQSMFAFSPLYSSSSGFFPGANNYLHQHLPLIPETDPFSFQQENLPDLTHHELDRFYNQPNWDADQEVLINPTPEILPQHPPPTPAASDTAEEEDVTKKKRHNASERMRRKKLNGLFAALSSVLPDADKTKKLKTPATVERVINYIPELRNEVESLSQRKQQLLLSTPTDDVVLANSSASSSSWFVDAVDVGNGDVSMVIPTIKSLTKPSIPVSYLLRLLEEEDGVHVVGVSSSESPSGRLFYHIHLHLEGDEGTHKINSELLRKKLLTSGRKWDDMGRRMMTRLNHVHG